MRIHHSAPYDPAGLVNHTHRRPLETNVQSCTHPHRCSPSFARGITSGKGRLPAGEQQPHVWDVLQGTSTAIRLLTDPHPGNSFAALQKWATALRKYLECFQTVPCSE